MSDDVEKRAEQLADEIRAELGERITDQTEVLSAVFRKVLLPPLVKMLFGVDAAGHE